MYVERKSKWKVIIVVIVLLIVSGVAYYGVSRYLKEEAERKKETEKEVKEEIVEQELSEAQKNSVLTKINFYDGMLPYGAFDKTNLNHEQALRFIDSIRDTEYVDFTKGVSLTKVNEILGRYFGENTHFSETETTCQDQETCFFYDQENTQFLKMNVDTYPYKTYNIFVSGTQNKETKDIQVQVRQLYYVDEGFQFYNSVEAIAGGQAPLFDLNAIYAKIFLQTPEYSNAINEQVKANEANIPVLTYYFVYQSGSYVLEKVEK